MINFTEKDLLDACMYAEISDSQYESMCIYLRGVPDKPLGVLKARGYTEEDLDASNPYTQNLTTP